MLASQGPSARLVYEVPKASQGTSVPLAYRDLVGFRAIAATWGLWGRRAQPARKGPKAPQVCKVRRESQAQRGPKGCPARRGMRVPWGLRGRVARRGIPAQQVRWGPKVPKVTRGLLGVPAPPVPKGCKVPKEIPAQLGRLAPRDRRVRRDKQAPRARRG